MKPNSRFLNLPKNFWASVRLISQEVGYTERKTGQIKIPTRLEITSKLHAYGIDAAYFQTQVADNGVSQLSLLDDYFSYRSDVLVSFVEPRLMNVESARQVFQEHWDQFQPGFPVPLNKQKGQMKTAAYLTGLVNTLIETNLQGLPCDYNPRRLTVITKDGVPLRTLARRVDGAFPNSVNPIAIWEIKEYYYTTTFGSRIADGIYESLLDGMELEELRQSEALDIKHYLIVDAHDTWWKQGKSYLCRIIDMLHMGYVDEVLFGFEVVERLPAIVKEWLSLYSGR